MLRALASLEGQAGLVGRNLYAGSIANQVVIVHAIRALTSTHLRGEGRKPTLLVEVDKSHASFGTHSDHRGRTAAVVEGAVGCGAGSNSWSRHVFSFQKFLTLSVCPSDNEKSFLKEH